MSDNTVAKDTIVIERIFDAPVELIWQMWTEPEHFKNWYGPKGFSVPVAEIDLRVGGRHLFCMEGQTPDGSMKVWTAGEYREIVPNKRLVYTDYFSDEEGNEVPPSAYGMGDDTPHGSTEVTLTFEDLGGRTRMILTHAGVAAEDQGANEGWKQSFEKLGDYIKDVQS